MRWSTRLPHDRDCGERLAVFVWRYVSFAVVCASVSALARHGADISRELEISRGRMGETMRANSTWIYGGLNWNLRWLGRPIEPRESWGHVMTINRDMLVLTAQFAGVALSMIYVHRCEDCQRAGVGCQHRGCFRRNSVRAEWNRAITTGRFRYIDCPPVRIGG